MTKARLVIGAVALLLMVGGSVWAFRDKGAGATYEEVKRLQEEMRAEGKNWTKEERDEKRKVLGEKMKLLSFADKKRFEDEKGFEKRTLDSADEFFKLQSEEERNAFLDAKIDKQIADMEKFRADMKAKRDAGEGRPPRNPDAAKGKAPNAEGTATNDGKGKRPQGPGVEERDKGKRERLDMHTPEERAKAAEYRRLMQARRLERGLPAGGGPGGGRGPGGGGPPGGGGRPKGN
ncbi:MAG: hypothetical protein K2R98_34410 [Gemmataceae bacterium]|nr:hypothetical protein [Gemmataceae bacterium]